MGCLISSSYTWYKGMAMPLGDGCSVLSQSTIRIWLNSMIPSNSCMDDAMKGAQPHTSVHHKVARVAV